MATQLKQTDFQPIPFPPRPSVRVVFSQPATSAVARSLAAIPDKAPLTLEQIEIGADAEALIATARQALSPHMFAAFLVWGEMAALALDVRNDDSMQDARTDRLGETIRQIYRSVPITYEDYAFKTWIAGIEAGDCTPLGPLVPTDGFGSGIRDGVASIATDLSRTSIMARELDRFAWAMCYLAGTSFNLPAPIADVIVASFDAAQQVFGALPVTEAFPRREIERTPSPFYRGLLLEWDKAYSSFREAVAFSTAATEENDPDDRCGAAESYALHRLLLTPAPSAAALAIKAQVFEEQECCELNAMGDVARVFTSDARRFAKLGAFPQQDAPLLSAFEVYRAANADHRDLPDAATQADEDACFDRMDGPMETLLNTRAATAEGVLAKLIYGFKAVSEDAWIDDVLLAPGSARMREGLAMTGMYERTLWGAIEDLARIAGVDLMEKAA